MTVASKKVLQLCTNTPGNLILFEVVRFSSYFDLEPWSCAPHYHIATNAVALFPTPSKLIDLEILFSFSGPDYGTESSGVYFHSPALNDLGSLARESMIGMEERHLLRGTEMNLMVLVDREFKHHIKSTS